MDLEIIKSRSGRAGSKCSLVFNQDTGFDSDLSLFILLKNNKMINGAGAYLHIGDRKDKSFRQSELKQKLASDPEFAEIFIKAALEVLETKLNNSPVDSDEEVVTESASSKLLNMIGF